MNKLLHTRASALPTLLLLMLLALLPTQLSAQDFTFNYTYEGQTLTYTVRDEDAKTVEVIFGKSNTGSVVIPSEVSDGTNIYSVTSIGLCAFQGNYWLTSVIIPNSVTSIREAAFDYCSNLTNVIFSNSATSIGKSAFSNCTSLKTLDLSDSVTSIGESAFEGCSGLTSVVIPSSVTSIGRYAFEYCKGLKKSAYPSSLSNPFSNGIAIVYPAEGTYIDENGYIWSEDKAALYFVPLNAEGEFTIPNSVTYIGKSAFSYCSALTSVIIPNSVTAISDQAFCDCYDLTSLIIPNSVTSIGDQAFQSCSGLQSVIIPNSVTSIGKNAFSGCSRLKKSAYPSSLSNPFQDGIAVGYPAEGNSFYENGYIWSENKTGLYFVPLNVEGEFIIPNSVTSIGPSAFEDCSGLTSVVIPNSVTSIGTSAFEGCSGLTSVVIPNSVTSIGTSAFSGCSELTSVIIPNSLTSIGNEAFRGCSGLTSVIIPNSVTSIGPSAFEGCSGLTSVIIPNSVTSIGTSAFNGCSGLTSLDIPNSVTSIGDYAFSGCSGLTSLDIPNSVTSIGYCAFRGCSGLTSVIIPNSVTSIGGYAFEGCSGLTSVIIPNSVTSKAYGVFLDCSGLKKSAYPSSLSNPFKAGIAVSYPAEGTYIYENGYIWSENKTGLYFVPLNVEGEFIIPNSVTSIGDEAFAGCNNLESVIIPNSVTSIGNNAFYRCSGLKKSAYPSSLSNPFSNGIIAVSYPARGSYIYENGYIWSDDKAGLYFVPLNVEGVFTIPNSVTSIGSSAFNGCSGLTSVIIPNSVTSIGDEAFRGCSGLKKSAYPSSLSDPFSNGISVSYPAQGSYIEDEYIWGEDKAGLYFVPWNAEGVFTLPESVTTIGAMAFYGCNGITGLSVESSVPASFNNDSFSNYNIDVTVPTGSLSAYAATNWTKFSNLKDASGVASVEFSDDVFNFRVISQDEVMLIAGNYNNMASVSIPERVVYDDKFKYVTVIGSSAFSDRNNMTSLVLPKRLKSISEKAFSGCTGLTTVNLPESLTDIGNSSFSGCTGLTTINFPESLTTIGNYSFSGCTGLTEFTLNGNIESIGDYAFSNCQNLLTFSGKNIASVGEGAFKNCSKLDNITVNWAEIANETFSNCNLLRNIDLTSNVKSIGNKAFLHCDGLSGLFIPASVNSIGDQAFYECMNLMEVYTMPSVNSIGDQAFYNCKNLWLVFLCEGLASIGNSTFYGCTGISEISIPSSVISIGSKAFYGCNLSEVAIPASVRSIGESAFESCLNMSKFSLEDGIGSIVIGDNAFYLAPIKDMYIGRYYTYNGSGSMSTGIESLTYGNTVAAIPANAFSKATGLKTVNFGSSIETIGENAFNGCALTELVLPPHVKTIGNNAFIGNNIKNIAIGSEVTEIGEKAFDGANELAGVSITAITPPAANNNSFSYYDCPLYVTPGCVDTYYNFTRCWYRFSGYDLIPIDKLEVEGKATVALKRGETYKFSVTMSPANASLPYIFWRSTNPEFATVDNEGNVTLVDRGGESAYADGEVVTDCKIIAETLYANAPVAEFTVQDYAAGVDEIGVDTIAQPERLNDIYNMQGICIKRNASQEDVKALAPGLYIIAGKKVLVK